MINVNFWRNRKVFVTGHTGFKGSWLCLWLHHMGAEVIGYALEPPTGPDLFELCRLDELIHSIIGDIRDASLLTKTLLAVKPEIVFHLAAQPIVRESYNHPLETYTTNVIGTINLFEAIRQCTSIRAVVNITTDKCYENKEWVWGYRENDILGGYDPYSCSKACSELITASYRNSFFNLSVYEKHQLGIATARAGNVIGGGDWALDRLVPDCFRALLNNTTVTIRNPDSIRPWQHVLEPLNGYMLLAEKLYQNGDQFSEAWNFGPNDENAVPAVKIIAMIYEHWGTEHNWKLADINSIHESTFLKLDSSKARMKLDWKPKLTLEETIQWTSDWYRGFSEKQDIFKMTMDQIKQFIKLEEA